MQIFDDQFYPKYTISSIAPFCTKVILQPISDVEIRLNCEYADCENELCYFTFPTLIFKDDKIGWYFCNREDEVVINKVLLAEIITKWASQQPRPKGRGLFLTIKNFR